MSKKGEHRPNQMLRDMRLIYSDKPISNPNSGQAALIEELKSTPRQFLDRMTKFEEAYAKRHIGAKPTAKATADLSPAAEGDESEEVADEGSERCLDLIDRLLKDKEWKDG